MGKLGREGHSSLEGTRRDAYRNRVHMGSRDCSNSKSSLILY